MIPKQKKDILFDTAEHCETASQLLTENKPELFLSDITCTRKLRTALIPAINKAVYQSVAMALSIIVVTDLMERCNTLEAIVF